MSLTRMLVITMAKKKNWAEHGPTDAVFYGVQNQKTIILVFTSYKLMTYYDTNAKLINEI